MSCEMFASFARHFLLECLLAETVRQISREHVMVCNERAFLFKFGDILRVVFPIV